MSSITRSHAVHASVTAPVLVAPLPAVRQVPAARPAPAIPVSSVAPLPVTGAQPEVAERVSARSHAAGAAAGITLVPDVLDDAPHDAEVSIDGLRFLGAGWAADAAVFAAYRRTGR